MTLLDRIVQAANEIFGQRYAGAEVALLAGSLVRGEGTPHSDLDIAVVFGRLPNAYRESFHSHGYPVEAFVHDPETLHYFITERERPAGVCVLAQMINEGVEIPRPSAFSQSLKRLAASVIDSGPPRLGDGELRMVRYGITNLIDDIRRPRSKEELTATGAALYDSLANCYLRANGSWSAKAKSIPRKLEAADPGLHARFREAFERLFVDGRPEQVIDLAEEVLAPAGGFLFDGHRLEAPASNRKPLEVGHG